MTIFKAIKSDLPFRREAWDHWILMPEGSDFTLGLMRDDIMATDWVVLNENRD